MTSQLSIARLGAFALVLTVCVGAAAQQTPTDSTLRKEHAMGTKMEAKGIPNFGKVTPNLYRGAQPSAKGLDALKKLGVDIVVDMRGRDKIEEQVATQLGMQYVAIPSHCPFPKDEPFAKFLRVIQDNPGKKVFVHCRLGDDRTGMAVAAYRMADEGWSADEAMKEMKTFGFSAVHHAMCPGLADYEENFPKRLKTSPAFIEIQPYGTPPGASPAPIAPK